MSTFQINIYLIDEFGDYVLTEGGDKIIISTLSIDVDENTRYIGGQISRRIPPVLSFKLLKQNQNSWYLYVNEYYFCGRYATQSQAIGVLYGLYTGKDGQDNGFANFLEESLNTRGSVIDADQNDLTIARSGSDIEVSLQTVNFAALVSGVDSADYDQGVFLGWQTQQPGSSTWDAVSFSNVINISSPITSDNDDGNIAQTTTTSAWDNDVPENGYVRPVVIALSGTLVATVIASGSPLLKDDADDTNISFTVLVSGASDSVTIPEAGGGNYAYAQVTDNSTLDPGESISFTYEWFRSVPTLNNPTIENLDEGS